MPDSPNPTRSRRAWRVMSALGCLLGALSILITAIKWTATDNRQDRQALVAAQAICAIILYAEQQADYLAIRNQHAAVNLEKLAVHMRETGIKCPPRKHHPLRRR